MELNSNTKKKEDEYSSWQLAKDIYPYIRPRSFRLGLATLTSVAANASSLYTAYGFALLINFLTSYKAGDSLQYVWNILGLMVLFSLIRFSTRYITNRVSSNTSSEIGLAIQTEAIAHLTSLDMAWHEKENTGNKLKRITRGSDSVAQIVRIWISSVLEIIIDFIAISFVFYKFDKRILLYSLVFLLTYYVFSFSLRKQIAKTSRVVNVQDEVLEGALFETVNNVRTIKVLGMARALLNIVKNETSDLYQKIQRRNLWTITGNHVRYIYSQLFEFLMIGVIVIGVAQGRYELGFLVLFYTYFSRLLGSVQSLADISQQYLTARLSVGRMFDILKEPITIDLEEGKVAFPADWKKISVENVSFSYEDNTVLHNISFDIERGEKIGIVGLSGAGKTTLFKLLLKEHESYTGSITFDDVPLTTIGRQDYFKYSGVVLQDTEVFNLSLRQNITLANDDQRDNDALFEKAIRVAHVEEFIQRLPQGAETLIGEKGVRLSGGERQRVGLARAVFKEPQLLLLDEATSHLDIESEEKIQASLHEFFRSVTAIVIAHRLTTIKEMDRIIMIESGKIIEQGTFEQLIALKGRFAELWDKQGI